MARHHNTFNQMFSRAKVKQTRRPNGCLCAFESYLIDSREQLWHLRCRFDPRKLDFRLLELHFLGTSGQQVHQPRCEMIVHQPAMALHWDASGLVDHSDFDIHQITV